MNEENPFKGAASGVRGEYNVDDAGPRHIKSFSSPSQPPTSSEQPQAATGILSGSSCYQGQSYYDHHPLQQPVVALSSPAAVSQSQHLFVSPNQPVYSNNVVSGAAPPTVVSTSTSVPGTNDPSLSSSLNDVRDSARKFYRNHGSGVTQTLEEIRRQDESNRSSLTARIVGANTDRRDYANNRYTSYIIQVKLPSSGSSNNQQQGHGQAQIVEIEHRYSEFAKLHDLLEQYHIKIYESSTGSGNTVSFPSKHLAGRLGNWTPSRRWAPNQHLDLVEYRKRQLDVWLTHVCHTYNDSTSNGKVLPQSVRHSIEEFLSPSSSGSYHPRPPCDCDYDQLNCDDCGDGDSQHTYRHQQSPSTFSVHNPIAFTLGKSIRQACYIVHDMCCTGPGAAAGSNSPVATSVAAIGMKDHDQSIPLDLLKAARGLMFLTVIKAGVVVSARAGTGLLVARLDSDGDQNDVSKSNIGGNGDRNDDTNDGKQRSMVAPRWSAPCAIGTVGMGWGMLAGGDITDYLIVLTTQEAVESVISGTQVQLGTEIDMAVGPVGRGTKVDISTNGSNNTNKIVPLPSLHPAYCYAHSKGIFIGMSLESSIVKVRHDVNANFYGVSKITPDQILDRPPPRAAQPLYHALQRAYMTEIPQDGFRPSQLFT